MGCLTSKWGIGLWSLGIWRLVVMLVVTGGVVAAKFHFGFSDIEGGVGSDFEAYGLPWEDRRVDSVISLGYQVMGVGVIIGAGVVADPGLVVLVVLHRV